MTEVCGVRPSSRLCYEASNHICFYSKQSGAGTAGSLSLLLKAFWGLLRDGPDGVIYPLFAEWTRIECDVYGHGIPISHPCQDTYPEGLMNLSGLLQQDETVSLSTLEKNNRTMKPYSCRARHSKLMTQRVSLLIIYLEPESTHSLVFFFFNNNVLLRVVSVKFCSF